MKYQCKPHLYFMWYVCYLEFGKFLHFSITLRSLYNYIYQKTTIRVRLYYWRKITISLICRIILYLHWYIFGMLRIWAQKKILKLYRHSFGYVNHFSFIFTIWKWNEEFFSYFLFWRRFEDTRVTLKHTFIQFLFS